MTRKSYRINQTTKNCFQMFITVSFCCQRIFNKNIGNCEFQMALLWEQKLEQTGQACMMLISSVSRRMHRNYSHHGGSIDTRGSQALVPPNSPVGQDCMQMKYCKNVKIHSKTHRRTSPITNLTRVNSNMFRKSSCIVL